MQFKQARTTDKKCRFVKNKLENTERAIQQRTIQRNYPLFNGRMYLNTKLFFMFVNLVF
jgi:hypothetical protein